MTTATTAPSLSLTPFSTCLLRTPLLPSHNAYSSHNPAVADGLLADAMVAEALTLATESASLLSHARRDAKLTRTLVKYIKRMSARCTPFGLCATVSVGTVANGATEFRLEPRRTVSRKARLDMLVVDTLLADLNASPDIRSTLEYSLNETAFRRGSHLRYYEIDRSRGRQVKLSSAVCDDALEVVLAAASKSASLGAIREAIAAHFSDDGIDPSEIDEYVNLLVDNQVLVSPLWLALTGADDVPALISGTTSAALHPAGSRLLAAYNSVKSIEKAGPLNDVGIYEQVASIVGNGVAARHACQIDAVRPAVAMFSTQDAAEIANALRILSSIELKPSQSALENFAKRFEERYGDRKVPVLEALDEEVGLGFENTEGTGYEALPLLSGIRFKESPATLVGFDHAKVTTLLGLVHRATRSQSLSVELTEQDLSSLRNSKPTQLADTIVALVVPVRENGVTRLLIKSAGGLSAGSMLARLFAADPQLSALLLEIAEHEAAQDPDATFCEIVHHSGGRDANVLIRPVMRQYETPIMARSGAKPSKQIPLADLLVSARNGQVVLTSRRLGRRVRPKITTAHNVRLAIPLYRFFYALDAREARSGLAWNWGPLAAAPFLPRISVGRIVFARAQWTARRADLRPGPLSVSLIERLKQLGAPKWVRLVEEDHELLINTDHEDDIEEVAKAIRTRGVVTLCEEFQDPTNCVGTSDDGHYFAEYLIPYKVTQTPAVGIRRLAASALERPLHGPGSQWRYIKIYPGGTSDHDAVIEDCYRKLIQERNIAVQKWFFVRYHDPEPHLRIRICLNGNTARQLESTIKYADEWAESLLKARIVWRVQIDTYDQEEIRYGGPTGLGIAERLFTIDSEFFAKAYIADPDAFRAADRPFTVAQSMASFLTDLPLSRVELITLLKNAHAHLAVEYSSGKDTHITLGSSFRSVRTRLVDSIERGNPKIAELLQARSGQLRPELERLLGATSENKVKLGDVLTSVIHMHLNRWCESMQRKQEFVLHNWLARYFDSKQYR